jgi:CheY-like chemotaxis protein
MDCAAGYARRQSKKEAGVARILVADDSKDIRLLLVRALTNDGHAVIEAADGERALELLITEQFGVAVLDVMMPGIDGLTLCRTLREAPGLGHLAIVVASAATSEVAALAAGADAFLSKPFPLSRLRTIVGNLARSDRPGARVR